MTTQEHLQEHYDVLALQLPRTTCQKSTQQEIKAAYRQALLCFHPDKSKGSNLSKLDTPKYTIDQVTLAYKTLIDPTSRSEYDRLLQLNSSETRSLSQTPYPGLETVDLDDLAFDEPQHIWSRGCRCGNEKCFLITEEELEKEAENGEVITGCRGCSLWLRVIFEVVEDG